MKLFCACHVLLTSFQALSLGVVPFRSFAIVPFADFPPHSDVRQTPIPRVVATIPLGQHQMFSFDLGFCGDTVLLLSSEHVWNETRTTNSDGEGHRISPQVLADRLCLSGGLTKTFLSSFFGFGSGMLMVRFMFTRCFFPRPIGFVSSRFFV